MGRSKVKIKKNTVVRIARSTSIADIKANRTAKGQLRARLIKPASRIRYSVALQLLLWFWKAFDCEPVDFRSLGPAVESFLEYIYAEVVTLKRGYDCVSGLAFYFPEVHSQLRVCRKMLRLWQSEEPPQRPVALTPEAVLAMAGASILVGRISFAAMLLLGFRPLLAHR